MFRIKLTVPVLLVAAGLTLAGCANPSLVTGSASVEAAATSPALRSAVSSTTAPNSSSASSSAAPAITPSTAVAAAAPPNPPAHAAAVGDLGEVLVGSNGLTLYGFTKDTAGVSTCFEACATAWPAVVVTGALPAGLDPAVFSLVERPDGTQQLKAGKWPLYFYSGDGATGESNGQGSGGVWFAVKPDGALVKDAADEQAASAGDQASESSAAPTAAPTAPTSPPAQAAAGDSDSAVGLAEVANLGRVMVGGNGHTVYAFTKDPEGQSTCVDACANAWPPLIVDDTYVVSDELSAQGVTTYTRPDGSKQLVMGKWALYYYSGDGAPGEANGQGSGGVWYAVDADCKLVKTALG